MSRPHFNRRAGLLSFHSRHEILDQMALEMINGLPDHVELKKRVHVYCGIHQAFPLSFLNMGFKLGIQTEQFFDEAGNELFGLKNQKGIENIKNALKKFDCILDLSFSNKLFYQKLSEGGFDISKVRYGPNIFFERAAEYSPANTNADKFLFFGSTDCDRRKVALRDLGDKCIVLSAGVHYDSLYREIKNSSGVLNVHYQEGVYSEVPRMLTALTCGKTLVSERLASPFVAGKHYHLTGEFKKELDSTVYTEAVSFLSANHSFLKFLKKEGLAA